MKIKLVAAAALSTMLMGCASTELCENIEALNTKVDSLATQVGAMQAQNDAIAADVQAAKNAAMDAQDEAARANARIDAMATDYRKK
ncbi:MAG: Lpp/OprI family alanine-zipper lipoprotein [Ferrimonas sp.]